MFSKRYLIVGSKVLLSVVAFSYIFYLVVGLFFDYLGPNPVEVLTHETGDWGLHFLLASLSITPLRRHYHWNFLIKYRRFLGLWSFAFIIIHLSAFIFFDHFFDVDSIIEDILERSYIAVGFVAFLIMLPLAISSLKSIQKKMGKYWIRLHRSVYIVAILGIIHYWWLVKADILWPLLYSLILAFLLGDRLYWYYRKKG